MNFNVQNEYGKLRRVVINAVPFLNMEGIEGQKNKDITTGQAELVKLFGDNGIDLVGLNTEKIYGKHFSWARDPFIVIGDKFFMINRTPGAARKEKTELARQLKIDYKDGNIITFSHEENTLEGGDVIPHNDTVYVGQDGSATNSTGLDFLHKHIGDKFKIVPMKMLADTDGIPIRHLDCAFNPLSKDEALIYPKGLTRRAQLEVFNNFNTIEVTGDEQRFLGTNVFSLGDRHVVSQTRHERINKILQDRGFTVSAVNFGNTYSFGGAVRCATSPLIREKE